MKNKNGIKILITDPIHPDAVCYLQKEGYHITKKHSATKEEILKGSHKHDVLICRTRTKLENEFFKSSKKIKCVALCSTGHDQIDTEAALKYGIEVFGLPSHNKNIDVLKEGNFISAAEHTILLILATLGNFYDAVKSMKEGRWEKHRLIGKEMYGKTLGIIGLGRIGKLVAQRARAFGMNVVAYDPYVPNEEIENHLTSKVSLADLCKKSDIITLHVPKSKETIGLLNKKHFSLMKKGVIIFVTHFRQLSILLQVTGVCWLLKTKMNMKGLKSCGGLVLIEKLKKELILTL